MWNEESSRQVFQGKRSSVFMRYKRLETSGFQEFKHTTGEEFVILKYRWLFPLAIPSASMKTSDGVGLQSGLSALKQYGACWIYRVVLFLLEGLQFLSV
eukprot:g42976.t1